MYNYYGSGQMAVLYTGGSSHNNQLAEDPMTLGYVTTLATSHFWAGVT